MTFRTAALAATAASLALVCAGATLAARAQTPADSQWRASPMTLATLLQDGYRIAAVVNDTRGNGGPADTIFVQRDQSAFKCIDPQQSDAKTRQAETPACYELVPPGGAAPASESK
ncbi:hypothetical protein GXB81_25865 [Paraburkholderia sp. Ac-20336]|uniref:hypothetical protein n=1 Tax=Burkholderiaceae TaxID=119060 RepID=UPI0014206A1F|nr:MULTISPECIES: hypothetical protein [Burkholderiaceae]MBN3806455.1 hypothetical protein [Paraburkholderia sp. Ac-20336]NIF52584.1 hypothetical protein [Burkholderia sp. Ax-1724]NIF80727.1 hypothetical protein [Paraburkholderia sp. Cy-641]